MFQWFFDAVVKEAVEKIIKKIKEGKKLTDAEVLLLIVSRINQDLKEFKEDANRRFERLEKDIIEIKDDIRFLRQEIMRIKTDIINILKEKRD